MHSTKSIFIVVVLLLLLLLYYLIHYQNNIPLSNNHTMNQTAQQNNYVTYHITFHALWSKETHKDWIPKNPHFSPPVFWTHKNPRVVFAVSEVATDGIKDMAETGSTRKLVKELEALQESGVVKTFVAEKGAKDSPHTRSFNIKIEEDFPYLSGVTMIAPSPDWFVSIQNLSLIGGIDGEGNVTWKENVTRPVTLYDAGTDSGKEFTSKDQETIPRAPIMKFPQTIVGLGYVELTLVK